MKKQNNTIITLAITVFLLSTVLYSCKPDEHHHHDHGAITRVQLVFVDSATNAAAGTFTWNDPDGIGGNNPIQIDTIKLAPAKVYKANVMLYALHEGTHEHNVTADILKEKNNHLFVYKNITANLSIVITDKDDNNLPIGIEAKWMTGASSTGQVNIVLRHQPGVKNGTEGPGDTDIDIVMPVVIQ